MIRNSWKSRWIFRTSSVTKLQKLSTMHIQRPRNHEVDIIRNDGVASFQSFQNRNLYKGLHGKNIDTYDAKDAEVLLESLSHKFDFTVFLHAFLNATPQLRLSSFSFSQIVAIFKRQKNINSINALTALRLALTNFTEDEGARGALRVPVEDIECILDKFIQAGEPESALQWVLLAEERLGAVPSRAGYSNILSGLVKLK